MEKRDAVEVRSSDNTFASVENNHLLLDWNEEMDKEKTAMTHDILHKELSSVRSSIADHIENVQNKMTSYIYRHFAKRESVSTTSTTEPSDNERTMGGGWCHNIIETWITLIFLWQRLKTKENELCWISILLQEIDGSRKVNNWAESIW